MATYKISITGYSSVTITYTVTNTDTATTIKYTNVKFTNTRSGGTVYKTQVTVDENTLGFGRLVNASVAAGTKSKSWSISKSKTYTKTHSSSYIRSTMTAAMAYNGEVAVAGGDLGITIPAKTSYVVSFDGNGSTGGSTASQTKWYGETLSGIAANGFMRDADYAFDKWNTASNGSGTDYAVGAAYTANAALKLYAQWIRKYQSPSLTITKAYRCNSAGNPDDEGAYAAIEASYALYDTASVSSGANSVGSWACTVNGVTATSKSSGDDSGLTGSVKFVVAAGMNTESVYDATLTLTDSNTYSGASSHSATVGATLPTAYYPLDIYSGGHGISFGGPAKKDGFSVLMDVFIKSWAGVIQMFAGSTPPAGWLLCDGSAVSREDYAVLYAAIGDTWGAGDGSTTFNLPDLRGRAPIGAGTGSGLTARTLGGTVGAETHTLTAAQSGLPAHTHTYWTDGDKYLGNADSIARRTVSSGSGATNHLYSTGATSRHDNTGAVTGGAKNASSAHNNMQPSAVVNFIIHTGKTN